MCQRENECKNNLQGCDHYCVDTYHAHHCACRKGYTLDNSNVRSCPSARKKRDTLAASSALDLVDRVKRQTNNGGCAELKVDIVFVVDSSGSIRDNSRDKPWDNWDLLVEFLYDIVDKLPIGQDKTHVGMVIFSNSANEEFDLDDYYDKAAMLTAITEMKNKYKGGNTNTQQGLTVMEGMFDGIRGDRADAQNIAIVVTDGISTVNPELTIPNAQRAIGNGIEIFSIGITDGVNIPELQGMSSAPQKLDENWFYSTDFQVLSDSISNILTGVCSSATTPAPEPANPNVYCFPTYAYGQYGTYCFCEADTCDHFSVNGTKCIDLNECDTNNGGCEDTCTNTDGSYQCSCRTGYRLASDKQACADVNECKENTDNCQNGEDCVNTVGGYYCMQDSAVLFASPQAQVGGPVGMVASTLGVSQTIAIAISGVLALVNLAVLIAISIKCSRRFRQPKETNMAPIDPQASSVQGDGVHNKFGSMNSLDSHFSIGDGDNVSVN